MIYFILRRTFQSVLTVLGVVTFTFFLVRLAGDPSRAAAAGGSQR